MMIRKKSTVLSLVFLCGTSSAFAQSSPSAEATFHNLQGQNIGKASLTQTANGVLIEMALSNVAAGEHGFHIHQTGTCDAADGFKSAGGHYEPSQHQHGYLDASGPHAGDMPNQFAGATARSGPMS